MKKINKVMYFYIQSYYYIILYIKLFFIYIKVLNPDFKLKNLLIQLMAFLKTFSD